jgi:hypothetical protein
MSPEKENTFRALKEQPLLSTSFLCRFGWHRWLKYSEPCRVSRGVWDHLIQSRSCDCCNLYNEKVLKKW